MQARIDLHQLPTRQQLWAFVLRERWERGATALLLAGLRVQNGIATLARDRVALAAGCRREVPLQPPTSATPRDAARVLLDLLDARRGRNVDVADWLAPWLLRSGFVPALPLQAGLRPGQLPGTAPAGAPELVPLAITNP